MQCAVGVKVDPLLVVVLHLLCPMRHHNSTGRAIARCALWSSRKTHLSNLFCGSTSYCELSHGVWSRRSFWTATTAATVSSLRAMQLCAQWLILFRVCNVSRSVFSGDVNTQSHTWTSGPHSPVINIVSFVAFLWMRCLPPSLSLVVHDVQQHRWTCNF